MIHSHFYIRSAVALFCSALFITSVAAPVNATVSDSLNADAVLNIQATDSIDYSDYINNIANKEKSDKDITVSAADNPHFSSELSPTIYTDYSGKTGKSLLTKEDDTITWDFYVSQSGSYSIEFTYYPVEGNGSPILRDILIDGNLPFKESSNISFERIWADESNEKSYDLSGNQILPAQVECPKWIVKEAMDSTGYINTPLSYYLEKGAHKITLYCRREPMLLYSIRLIPEVNNETYKEKTEEYKQNGIKSASLKYPIIIEAENAICKSDQTIYPYSDRTSPSVNPYSSSNILYNSIGGNQWKTAGQWIEWEVDVPTDGLCNIGAHFKQSLKSGSNSIRELYIDGKAPFNEALSISFPYKNAWQTDLFKNDSGEAFCFYLTKGKHTIRLKAGLGETSELLNSAKKYLLALNVAYRQIVIVTGTSPDVYRDYDFEQTIPETLEELKNLSKCLKDLSAAVENQNNGLMETTAVIRKLYRITDQMTEDPENIATLLNSWKDNISAFGTWINDQNEQPLLLDYLFIISPDSDSIPKSEAGFFKLVKHYFLQFFYSFINDYSSIGELDTKTKNSISVWMFSGRDQAQILRRLIGNNFTPSSNISVNLQLVSSGALLPAILAKNGPDICLGLAQEEPLNLALRSALVNLSDLPDFNNVFSRFNSALCEPFFFKNSYWALPETQSFPVLFYRTDILKEADISTEMLSTWESVLNNVLPKLRRSSLSFGLLPSINSYSMFLYQYGGSLYYDDGKTSGLNSAQAIQAMNDYTTLYTQYGLDISYDFANRFRSGEMPVAVADFTTYNQLTVFAPEIRGLWDILPVPGTEKTDGTIDNTSIVTVTGSVILSQSEKIYEAWEFLKWWTSQETQNSYGNDVESIIGSAARYNSANKNAFESIPWDSTIKKSLLRQSVSLQAIPQVPGGYFTTRSYDFAFRDIVYSGEEVRETLLNSADTINKEIKNKRDEYHLD